MTKATVEIAAVGGDQTFDTATADRLREAGVLAEGQSGPPTAALRVSVATIKECRLVGTVIATWLQGTSGDFELRFDGPGATLTLHQLRTEDDQEYVSGLLASAAYLQ